LIACKCRLHRQDIIFVKRGPERRIVCNISAHGIGSVVHVRFLMSLERAMIRHPGNGYQCRSLEEQRYPATCCGLEVEVSLTGRSRICVGREGSFDEQGSGCPRELNGTPVVYAITRSDRVHGYAAAGPGPSGGRQSL
jgi:hypothetical protein